MEKSSNLWATRTLTAPPRRRWERWSQNARTLPCAVLLAVQLLGILLYPYMDEATLGDFKDFGRSLFGLFGLLVLFLAVWAVRATPALTWVSVLLGVPVVVLTILEAFHSDNAQFVLWSALLHACFYFYTAYGLIRYMFADNWVTRDELFATGAAFTVVAWGFAYLYTATQIVWPGSFLGAIEPERPRTWMELLYLSTTTLTSTGLSDIVPVRSHSRSFVMIEQVGGMMYVALVVARLVGLTIARFRR